MKISFPFILGIAILWWMYRGIDWRESLRFIRSQMNWGWMLFSLVFGVLAQQARAWRWRMALAPLGERPSRTLCEDAVFVSYAASLLVPRIGELTRCGTLKSCAGVSFSKSLGTVFTERVVDSLVIFLLTILAFLAQIPMFMQFMRATGTDLHDVFHRFTAAGYLVTAFCGVAAVSILVVVVRKYFSKGQDFLGNLWAGIISLKKVKNLPLYVFLSLLIWACYFLHFYIAFFSFSFTAHVDPAQAFLIFCVSSFAVLVPTPNGAGPWHFAVKTMLVIYGVAENSAILFALAVHSIQTGLVVLLGVYGWCHILIKKKKKGVFQPVKSENKKN